MKVRSANEVSVLLVLSCHVSAGVYCILDGAFGIKDSIFWMVYLVLLGSLRPLGLLDPSAHGHAWGPCPW